MNWPKVCPCFSESRRIHRSDPIRPYIMRDSGPPSEALTPVRLGGECCFYVADHRTGA